MNRERPDRDKFTRFTHILAQGHVQHTHERSLRGGRLQERSRRISFPGANPVAVLASETLPRYGRAEGSARSSFEPGARAIHGGRPAVHNAVCGTRSGGGKGARFVGKFYW